VGAGPIIRRVRLLLPQVTAVIVPGAAHALTGGFEWVERYLGASANPEAAYASIAQRRSVRNYKEQVPPRELLETIIGVAGYAPGSPHHRVGWVRTFTVVSGEAQMRRRL